MLTCLTSNSEDIDTLYRPSTLYWINNKLDHLPPNSSRSSCSTSSVQSIPPSLQLQLQLCVLSIRY